MKRYSNESFGGGSRGYVHLFLRNIQTQIKIRSLCLGVICIHTLGSLKVLRKAPELYSRGISRSQRGELCVEFWTLQFTPLPHTHCNSRSGQPKNTTCFKLCIQIGSKENWIWVFPSAISEDINNQTSKDNCDIREGGKNIWKICALPAEMILGRGNQLAQVSRWIPDNQGAWMLQKLDYGWASESSTNSAHEPTDWDLGTQCCWFPALKSLAYPSFHKYTCIFHLHVSCLEHLFSL